MGSIFIIYEPKWHLMSPNLLKMDHMSNFNKSCFKTFKCIFIFDSYKLNIYCIIHSGTFVLRFVAEGYQFSTSPAFFVWLRQIGSNDAILDKKGLFWNIFLTNLRNNFFSIAYIFLPIKLWNINILTFWVNFTRSLIIPLILQ